LKSYGVRKVIGDRYAGLWPVEQFARFDIEYEQSDWNVLAASHTTELAEKWGRRIRNLVSQHSRTLGISLAADSQAAGRWALANGAEYYAAGVGTGIAGFRAIGQQHHACPAI
jgi:hypothetical protein